MKPGGSLDEILQANRKDSAKAVLFGAHLPALYFVLVVALFSFARHHSPTAPWLALVLGGTFILLGAWPSWYGPNSRSVWDWFPLASASFAISVALWLGRWNSTTIEPYVHGQFLTRYSDVLPTTDPMTVSDAGILHFAAGTVLDTGSSAGFQAWPHTYCAAPIVTQDGAGGNSTGGSGAVKVGFWAVGIDCCATRDRFECDDALNAATRSGFRVESHILGTATGHDVQENFKKAVRMSAAAYGLEVKQEPILISWQRDPEFISLAAYQAALIVFICLSMVALCCCMGCQQLIVSYSRSQ
eukprot:TRINITY_DN105030_c0_g1_i1.p1 TRINITY_DN105030_c0_g1~~TRINITY_DN105030_c0_g1_i1.p1  ORF type:complete len:300 (+),score=56.28 TRINITY_DN105030_c0_g1_i1:134-1033(+)